MGGRGGEGSNLGQLRKKSVGGRGGEIALFIRGGAVGGKLLVGGTPQSVRGEGLLLGFGAYRKKHRTK